MRLDHCVIAVSDWERSNRFYADVVGPYWPPERIHCMNGYRDFDFPFGELPFPPVTMELQWDFDGLLDYIATWSAVVRYRKATTRFRSCEPNCCRCGVSRRSGVRSSGPWQAGSGEWVSTIGGGARARRLARRASARTAGRHTRKMRPART